MSSQPTPVLETIIQRDRLVLLSGLVGISAIAWAYTIVLSGDAGHAAHAAILAEPRTWTGTDFAMTFGMWTVMMMAMMLPTAAPMVLTLGKISREQSVSSSPVAPATCFLLGYAIVMTAFSLIAAFAQWGLHHGPHPECHREICSSPRSRLGENMHMGTVGGVVRQYDRVGPRDRRNSAEPQEHDEAIALNDGFQGGRLLAGHEFLDSS